MFVASLMLETNGCPSITGYASRFQTSSYPSNRQWDAFFKIVPGDGLGKAKCTLFLGKRIGYSQARSYAKGRRTESRWNARSKAKGFAAAYALHPDVARLFIEETSSSVARRVQDGQFLQRG